MQLGAAWSKTHLEILATRCRMTGFISQLAQHHRPVYTVLKVVSGALLLHPSPTEQQQGFLPVNVWASRRRFDLHVSPA